MSWFFRPYVSAAERRRKAEVAAKKLSKKGRALAPVLIEGRKIATTFWGKSWCDNLESYSDYSNRLPRGRTYARNGSVIDLQIAHGKIEALVQGSSLYKVSITIGPLGARRWQKFKQSCAGKLTNLFDLLQGRLSKEILADITTKESGLFPSPKEITFNCSCPDWAGICKHLAAVLYGVGARLDAQPEMFFTLRGVEMQDLIAAAGATAVNPGEIAFSGGSTLPDSNLSEIFGVEIELAPESNSSESVPVVSKPVAVGKKAPRQKQKEPPRKAKPAPSLVEKALKIKRAYEKARNRARTKKVLSKKAYGNGTPTRN